MKRMFCLLFILLFPVHSAWGAPLQDRSLEFNFDLIYDDTDNAGTITTLDGAVLFIPGSGLVEPGFFVNYFIDDPDGGSSFDGYAIGPRVDLNLTPDLNVTPYFTASFGFIGGDLGDIYDNLFSIGVGLKAFINEWAAFTVTFERRTQTGERNVKDLDTNLLTAGFSLFGGNK